MTFTAVYLEVPRATSLSLRNSPAPTPKGRLWKKPARTSRKPSQWYCRRTEISPNSSLGKGRDQRAFHSPRMKRRDFFRHLEAYVASSSIKRHVHMRRFARGEVDQDGVAVEGKVHDRLALEVALAGVKRVAEESQATARGGAGGFEKMKTKTRGGNRRSGGIDRGFKVGTGRMSGFEVERSDARDCDAFLIEPKQPAERTGTRRAGVGRHDERGGNKIGRGLVRMLQIERDP